MEEGFQTWQESNQQTPGYHSDAHLTETLMPSSHLYCIYTGLQGQKGYSTIKL